MNTFEDLKDGLRKFAEDTTGMKVIDTEIQELIVKGKVSLGGIKIRVGEGLPMGTKVDFPGEIVLAIFETPFCFLVITPNRGGLRGMPYFFGKEEVVGIVKNHKNNL